MADRAAADASPLIALSQAGHLELLRVAADEIVVPRAVADEVSAYGPRDPTAIALATTPWLVVIEPLPIPESIAGWDLGAGESAVLAWALSHAPAQAIVDDAEARRCAETHGVHVRGTLGIVLAAKLSGRMPAARPVLDRLRGSGFGCPRSYSRRRWRSWARAGDQDDRPLLRQLRRTRLAPSGCY